MYNIAPQGRIADFGSSLAALAARGRALLVRKTEYFSRPKSTKASCTPPVRQHGMLSTGGVLKLTP